MHCAWFTHLTMVILEGSYLSWLTPITNMGASGDGADTTTRLAPPWMWAYGGWILEKSQFYNIWCYTCTFQIMQRRRLTEALSMLRKTPVDSTTYRAPASPHGISAGFMLCANKRVSTTLQAVLNSILPCSLFYFCSMDTFSVWIKYPIGLLTQYCIPQFTTTSVKWTRNQSNF